MAKSKSGGGANSRQVKQVKPRTGPPNTNKINPCAVAQIGTKLGNPQAVERINAGTMPQVPLGNAVALNVNGGGPGKGREVVGKSGTQAQHGSGGSPRSPGRDWA